MKIDVEKMSPVQQRIRVEVPADRVDREFARAYDNITRRARVRGFRPGKTPRSVLQGLYREEVRGEVLSRLVEESLRDACVDRKIEVVSRPKIETGGLREGAEFSFSAVVEVKPDIAVASYLGLEIERVRLEIREADVEAALRRLQEHHAQLEPVTERNAVEEGDFVVVDFAPLGEKPSPLRRKVENYSVEIGKGAVLADFDRGLVGLEKNVAGVVPVAYPADYPDRDLAGNSVSFTVTVKEIKKKLLPPLDDEFAKDHGECSTLDELRAKVRDRLEGEIRAMQRESLKSQIVAKLIEAHPFEVPQSMVESEARYLAERRHHHHGAGAGHPHDESPELPPEELEALRAEADRRVRGQLLLETIAEREKIDVAEEELQRRVDVMARGAGARARELRQLYQKGALREQLRSQLMLERTLDFLLDRAKVTEKTVAVDAEGKKS
jgi:trigger factor